MRMSAVDNCLFDAKDFGSAFARLVGVAASVVGLQLAGGDVLTVSRYCCMTAGSL